MIALHFAPTAFPRTITRAEWREIDRWRRVTQKKLAEQAQRQMNDFIAFGSTLPPHVREDILERMINPLLLVHEKQQFRNHS